MTEEKFPGLSDDDVKTLREQFGPNSSGEEKQNRGLLIAREIASEPMFILLVAAALIYFILGSINEGVIMIVALVFVSGISLFQERKSRKALDALREFSAPQARVIRNGKKAEIKVSDLVPGDIIVVEDGDIVPADAELLELHDLSVIESAITGESLPVMKNCNTDDQNKLYGGTVVSAGYGIAKVTATGANSEIGKIGATVSSIGNTKTPLQVQVRNFVRSMVGIGAIAFAAVCLINYAISGNWLKGLLGGLTLAMSILPEEIPVAFSTFMALGAYHLYRKKVISSSPYTVETLGAATVICADKTGTITENEMKIAAIYDAENSKLYDYTQSGVEFNAVIEYAMWASEPAPFDKMEIAIHQAYGNCTKEDKRRRFNMLREYPLGGTPPMMTHVFSDGNKELVIAVKGSAEAVVDHSRLRDGEREHALHIAKKLAAKGYRVLGVGYAKGSPDSLPLTQEEFVFEFTGLIAFYDPPKNNIREIINSFRKAGIDFKMITGDHPETALAIAIQTGMNTSGGVITGKEIALFSDDKLQETVKSVNVFARMFPESKLRVIEALKANGEVVAMTGDGVNDGPALKAAHIGIAMGKRGTQLARRAASLVLMDDDLIHMVDAVAIGRRIYENLKKAIQYIISIHIPIILIVTLPLLLLWKYISLFSPVHVIFLELIMGPTCSIVFEREPIEPGSMLKPPRVMSRTFFSVRELTISVVQGVVITLACLGTGYYYMAAGFSEDFVRTVVYSTLIFSNLFLTLTNRSFYYSVVSTLRYRNKLLPIVLIISVVVLFASIYYGPLQQIFDFVPLGPGVLACSLAVAFCGVLWIEAYKSLKRMLGRQITPAPELN